MSTELQPAILGLYLNTLVAEGILKARPVEAPESIAFLGKAAVCDSVNLVAYLVALEERINGQFSVQIALMDDKAMSQTKSPFRTVATLAEFASQLVGQAKHP